MDYGIKVTQEGVSTATTDIREILMSSEFPMLKYHSDTSTSLDLTPGDTSKYIDVSHDLGYVPAFICYNIVDGKTIFIPSLGRATDFNEYTYAWADSSKVRAGIAFTTGAYGQQDKEPQSSSDYWDEHFGTDGFILIGKKDGNSRSGAIRFPSVPLNNSETITSATLDVAVEFKGAGATNLIIQTYGIDEDNTSSFTSSPMGRSRTTAVTSQSVSLPTTGEFFGINVKSQVEEIITRGGWSYGNAMGFHILDNGTADTVWSEDDLSTGITSRLKLTHGSTKTINYRVVIFKDKIN